MRATLEDAKILKTSIDSISNVIDEAGVTVNREGMSLRAMDPAHVAFVDLVVEKDAFSDYEVEEELSLGLDLDRLNTILKRAGTSDEIVFSTTDSASLNIKIRDSSTRRFELPLIDIGDEDVKLPQLDFPAVLELDPSVLNEGIKDAEIVSDNLIFEASEDKFFLRAKGDLGSVETEVAKEDTVEFNVGEASRSMFSIEYLKDMIKASDIAKSVKVYFGSDIPLKLEFIAPSVTLSFLLAPRVESE